MKNKTLNYIILFVIGNILLSCSNKTSTLSTADSFKNELIFKKNTNGEKIIFGNKLKDVKIIETEDGVALFIKKKEDYFENLITVIPHNIKEKKILMSFLHKDKISFEYKLGSVIFSHPDGKRLIFIVNNNKGMDIAKSFDKSETIFYCNQIAFSKNNKFMINKFEGDISEKKTNVFVGIVVAKNKKIASSNKGCTSGGTGSTSCSVGDVWSSCSVSCGSGYYACCQGSDNTCHCVKNTPKK